MNSRLQQLDPRNLPARPLNVSSDTWLALILCADGWSQQEIEEHFAGRQKQPRHELTGNQRRWLAEAYDKRGGSVMAIKDPDTRSTFTVYLARSGKRLEIHAGSWREALEQVSEPDACLIEKAGERAYDATLLIDGELRIINTRARIGTEAEALRWTLDNAARAIDANAGAGGAA